MAPGQYATRLLHSYRLVADRLGAYPDLAMDDPMLVSEPILSNRAFRGAWRRGYRAGLDGQSRSCPYPDRLTLRGRVTFSRAFARYWYEGWAVGDRTRQGISG